ncbi:YqgE/AlgH family protein [Wielerella bovis]|uniref:YqgE/AlgH family protein n=1 Tax=Wielerella bovis TaxID=2917790 RepID=UPI002019F970|nr:YqgE/AlgH family protein [Wielerella bovis]ULJ59491.1 YqgE/AlgH family protein [Wielerella bovis]
MNLSNHFLIAMPTLNDSFFSGCVVYLCEHSNKGAMGFVINKASPVSMDIVFSSTGKTTPQRFIGKDVMLGGPLHPDRGFVLHSPVQTWQNTMPITEEIVLTTSRDILEGLANQDNESDAVLTMGYSSWEAGQLEKEIAQNTWLVANADSEIIFRLPTQERYAAAFAKLGIRPENLMGVMGHA